MKKIPGVRGSSKHILDWLDSGKTGFVNSLNRLLVPSGAIVAESDTWMPTGRGDDSCTKEARLDQDTLGVLSPVQQDELASWWQEHRKQGGANTPNWDLASSGSIGGVRGLVLVEAKAHPKELSVAGKDLTVKGSARSKENDRRIGLAIDEARAALQQTVPAIAISKDRHYQLSNRIAFSWKLASMGIPVVLVYLGFLKDEGLRDIDTPLGSHEEWLAVMKDHMKDVVPAEFAERRIDCGKASMQFVIRSQPVRGVSPSRAVMMKRLSGLQGAATGGPTTNG